MLKAKKAGIQPPEAVEEPEPSEEEAPRQFEKGGAAMKSLLRKYMDGLGEHVLKRKTIVPYMNMFERMVSY